MAFRELVEGLKLPEGASDRYRLLTGLERMLTGELYDDLKYSFEEEKYQGKHVPLRERRPSVDFNLAYEITHDTLAELFGDEQFPVIQVSRDGSQIGTATEVLADLIDNTNLQQVVAEAYEEGVIGGVAIIVHRSDDGTPYYEIQPAKYCEPIYRSKYSNEIVALTVTYPITRDAAEEMCPGLTDEEENKGTETFWFRYVVGPVEQIDYRPLSDYKFAKLGEKNKDGEVIEFVQHARFKHGFNGRVPVVYTKNLGGKQRELDGPALWWPIRNICVEIDYTLSQCGRGLRYAADPMLFVKRGDLNMSGDDTPAGFDVPAAGMATALGAGGEMVKGVTQTLEGGPGSDAKLLEITADGIEEEREFVRDLREYALEVIGGMKARAEHLKGAPSGTALDKGLKPLRRLVRRQRRPYGRGMLLGILDLTLYGLRIGILSAAATEVDIKAVPEDAKLTAEWPNDETLQGQELLYHVEAVQLSVGGSLQQPKELFKPEVGGAKLAADIGLHEPYETIKGNLEATAPAEPPKIVTP